MASAKLASIPDADIDPNGVFKYVLIRVNSTEDDDSSKDIVRGYAWAEYHGKEVVEWMEVWSLECSRDRVAACRVLVNQINWRA